MANVYNNNFHNLKLKVNYDEYWDIFINKDADMSGLYPNDGSSLYDKCLLSYIDAELDECKKDRLLLSVSDYKWEDAIINSYTLHNIGYTGLDNGLITFQRDRIDNKKFIDIYTKSTYDINEDYRLTLHQVSGGTHLYEYPVTVENDKIKLNGGFYQGFFRTECSKYNILPSKLNNGEEWHFEFTLNKTEFEKESDKTLNDKYPENKGIFFYIGTRAENKWTYLYNKNLDGCLELGVDDFVEDGEISKEDYKIANFIDMSLDFEDLGEVFIDDYINFKYFSDELYHGDKCSLEDFFIDDYLVIDEKPRVIDETQPHSFVGWCCNSSVKNYYSKGKDKVDIVCTCCGCRKKNVPQGKSMKSNNGRYLSQCDIFGEDYLSDLDDMDDGWDYFEDDLDIRDFHYETFNGIDIKLNQFMIETDNKFLLFDRTCNGFTTKTWEEGSVVRYYQTKSNFKENLFLLMNRTCTGYTTHTIDKLREEFYQEYNYVKDIYNNALAFRITDDGAIGYRYLELDCESETKFNVHEAYSKNGIITEDTWHLIDVKIHGGHNVMVLHFYVDGNLIFISEELPKLNLRELDEPYEKQETVPYNISLGGGTQGLAETILPNYMLDPYKVFPLEQYFAGTFIGYLKRFRFYNCELEHASINNNFKFEMRNWKINNYL